MLLNSCGSVSGNSTALIFDGITYEVRIQDLRSLPSSLILCDPYDALMVCYSVVDSNTLDFLKYGCFGCLEKFEHERIPSILVGNKLDLASNMLDEYVSAEDAETVAKEIGATVSMQCSSLAHLQNGTGNVEIAFKAAIKCAFEHHQL